MMVMVYVFGWLIAYVINRAIIKDKKGKTFITMSVWAYITFNITLMLITFITYKHFINKLRTIDLTTASEMGDSDTEMENTSTEQMEDRPTEIEGTPAQQLSYNDDNVGFIKKLTWLLYTTSLTMSFMVTAGYYTAAGTDFDDFDVFALHIHGINFLIMCTDFLLSQIPIHFLHFYFPTIFVVVYLIFTGIYYAAGGTGAQGKPYIYPLLDYKNGLGKAILLAIVLVIVTAIVHCIFSAVAILRDYVGTRYRCCSSITNRYRISVSGSETS